MSSGTGAGANAGNRTRRPSRDTDSVRETASATYAPLLRALISAAIGLSAYYGARALGASQVAALMACAIASGVRVSQVALSNRHIDAIAGFILSLNASTIVVALTTKSPLITLLSEHVPGVVFAIWVFGGLARGRPITETILTWLRPSR